MMLLPWIETLDDEMESDVPTGFDPVLREGRLGRLNTVDMHLPIEQLGNGLGRAAVKAIPQHQRILAESFERAGWDPARFRGYRTEVRYPVPMVTMTWWFALTSP